ncbi:hypothetical protein ACJX0J_034560, partial [Zea mays]
HSSSDSVTINFELAHNIKILDTILGVQDEDKLDDEIESHNKLSKQADVMDSIVVMHVFYPFLWILV